MTAGDRTRRTGGNIYVEHVVSALRHADLIPSVLILGSDETAARLRATHARVVVIDTIAARTATPLLHPLRARGVHVIALALMWQGALALAQRADRVVSPSEAIARELAARGIPRELIAVVPPGREDLPVERLGEARVPRILCVANWIPTKGIHTVLDAVSRIPDATVDLVGDAPDARYDQRVRSILDRPRLAGRVTVHGPLRGRGLARRYADATIFALPSTLETYGMAVAEALTYGLPVVAYDTAATREVVGDTAMLVPWGDAREFGRALRQLVADKEAREALSRRARARARQLPTWRESQAAIADVVRALLVVNGSGADARRTPRGRLS